LAGSSKRKIIAKKIYEPEFVEPKKKLKKMTTEDKVYTNLTPIVQLPEPPALSIQYNDVDDNPYDGLAYSKSNVENNETLQENIPSTSSIVSTITSFKINNIMSGKL